MAVAQPRIDDVRAAYLANNRIAIGPPGDPEEFEREFERFERLLPRREPLRVLDIGCGTGAYSVHWAARGCRVTGVDIDPEFIVRARQRERLQDAAAFRGVVADATRLPADLGQFDLVLIYTLLEHVPDWHAVVSGAVRTLAPGGVLVLHTTNRWHPLQAEINGFPFYPWLPGAVQKRVLDWIMRKRPDMVNFAEYPAVNWFTHRQLSGTLRELGLEVYDRLDLMRPEQLTGMRRLARWMVGGEGGRARGKYLYYLLASTVSLYAKRPE